MDDNPDITEDPIQRRAEQHPPERVESVLSDALELLNVAKGYYRDDLSPTELARLSEAYTALGSVEESVRWRRDQHSDDG